MDSIFQMGVETLQISHSPVKIFFNIIMAALLSWAIIKLYLKHYRGYGQPYQMCLTLMITSVVTCSIIMIIGANIALSLGLVGALSIIRFRTPVKDSRDLAYLFWAICVGLGSGASAYIIVLILTVLLGIIVLYLESNPVWATRFADYLLVLNVDKELPDQVDLLKHLPSGSRFKSLTSMGDVSEITYSLPDVEEKMSELTAKLRKIDGVHNVHVISPDYEVLG